jgi:AhpC/TSA family
VSEDRFEDLGPKQPARPAAQGKGSTGDKLAERDRTHPEPVRPPEVPRPGNKYAWAVGILMLMGLGVLLFAQTLPNQGEGLVGLERGEPLPAFAAPLATGNLEGDVNLCEREPCADDLGESPACELDRPGVITSCELSRDPLVLTFVFDRAADCNPQVDRTERVKDDLDGVRFATVYFSRKERSELRALVEARGWSQPVAVDEDGQLSTRYGVGVCPTTIFVRSGGTVLTTKLGLLTEDQIRRNAERLLR